MQNREIGNQLKKRALGRQIRIFILDDYPIVRQGLTQLAAKESGFTICGQSAQGEEALKLINQLKPDVVILDIALRGINGLDLIHQIKSTHPDIRILVISVLEESVYAERALRAGASGYVMKMEATEKLKLALHQVLENRIYLSKAIADKVATKPALFGPRPQRSLMERLSDRELQVFQLIAEGRGTRQIAEELGLSIKTIDTYREHIKQKLDLPNAPALREYAIRWSRSDKIN